MMAVRSGDFVIKAYDPHARAYASRISEQQWNQYKSILLDYHQLGMSRAQMLTKMHSEHNFHPTKQQLGSKMLKWGLQVYSSRKDRTASSKTAGNQPVKTFSTPAKMKDISVRVSCNPGVAGMATISTTATMPLSSNDASSNGCDTNLFCEHKVKDSFQAISGTDVKKLSRCTTNQNLNDLTVMKYSDSLSNDVTMPIFALPSCNTVFLLELMRLFGVYNNTLETYDARKRRSSIIAPFIAAAWIAEIELSTGKKNERYEDHRWRDVSWEQISEGSLMFFDEFYHTHEQTLVRLSTTPDLGFMSDWVNQQSQAMVDNRNLLGKDGESDLTGAFIQSAISASTHGITGIMKDTTPNCGTSNQVADASSFAFDNLADALERLYLLDKQEQIEQYILVMQNALKGNLGGKVTEKSIDSIALSANGATVLMKRILDLFMDDWKSETLGIWQRPKVERTSSHDWHDPHPSHKDNRKRLAASTASSDERSFWHLAKRIKSNEVYRDIQPRSMTSHGGRLSFLSDEEWRLSILDEMPVDR